MPMEPEAVRKRKAVLDARHRALAEKMALLKNEYRKLRLDCTHPNLKKGRDMCNDAEYWCEDCGLSGSGTYVPGYSNV